MFINTHTQLLLPEATHAEIDGNAVFVWGLTFYILGAHDVKTTKI